MHTWNAGHAQSGRVAPWGWAAVNTIWRMGLVLVAGECAGTVLIHCRMASEVMTEASVIDAISMGEPKCLDGGARCHTH